MNGENAVQIISVLFLSIFDGRQFELVNDTRNGKLTSVACIHKTVEWNTYYITEHLTNY